MRNCFIIILLFPFCFTLSAQKYIDNHLLPSLEAAEYVYNFYIPANAYADFICPPKLVKPNTDTLFSFLERLIGDSAKMEEKILQTMMSDNCRPYYTCRGLNDLYSPVFREALKKNDLSELYALLPVALSGSNPGYQSELGKAGAWQLSYIVGRKFGLTINDYFDERKDIYRSTNAAVKYLRFLDQLFAGNRLLVITAFYTSVPYVKKIVDTNNTFNPALFFKNLDVDVRNFIIYFNTWHKWYRHFESSNAQKYLRKTNTSLTSILSKDTIKFDWIAAVLPIDVSLIEAINPAYSAKVLLPGHQRISFYLPEKKAAQFNEKYDEIIKVQREDERIQKKHLAELEERMSKGIPDPKITKAIHYTVKSGDVLGIIAQRYQVKISSIKQWNNLRSDRINIGQDLVIYIPKNSKNRDNDYLISTQKKKNNKAIPKPGKGTYKTYEVKPGESLWLIAKKFPGVSAENIMEWNGINDKINPGQKLKIYQ